MVSVSVVELAAPDGVTVDGENVQVVPEGNPEHTNETAEWNPFDGVIAMVAFPLCPGSKVSDDSEELMEKSELGTVMI